MTIDPNLFAARRIGFGLKVGDDLPAPPREWAMEQVRSIPKLDFYNRDGSSLAATIPADAALTDYLAACIRFGEQQYTEDSIRDKRSPDEGKLMDQMFA